MGVSADEGAARDGGGRVPVPHGYQTRARHARAECLHPRARGRGASASPTPAHASVGGGPLAVSCGGASPLSLYGGWLRHAPEQSAAARRLGALALALALALLAALLGGLLLGRSASARADGVGGCGALDPSDAAAVGRAVERALPALVAAAVARELSAALASAPPAPPADGAAAEAAAEAAVLRLLSGGEAGAQLVAPLRDGLLAEVLSGLAAAAAAQAVGAIRADASAAREAAAAATAAVADVRAQLAALGGSAGNPSPNPNPVSRDLELLLSDASGVGLPDYALLAAGAAVVDSTASFAPKAAKAVWARWEGWRWAGAGVGEAGGAEAVAGWAPVRAMCECALRAAARWAEGLGGGRWDVRRPVEAALRAGRAPGECWAAAGRSARLLVRLASPVAPAFFSVEHTPDHLALDASSAPRNLSVWGVRSLRAGAAVRRLDQPGTERVLLARHAYAPSARGLDTFAAGAGSAERGGEAGMPGAGVFAHVELCVESNHGHPHYTALYRFRVHAAPFQRARRAE